MSFPIVRNRRLRGNAAIRNLVRENQVPFMISYNLFLSHMVRTSSQKLLQCQVFIIFL